MIPRRSEENKPKLLFTRGGVVAKPAVRKRKHRPRRNRRRR